MKIQTLIFSVLSTLLTFNISAQLSCDTEGSSNQNSTNYDPCTLNPDAYEDFGNELFIPQADSELLEVKTNIWIFSHPIYSDGVSDLDNTHFTLDPADPDFNNQANYLKSVVNQANVRVYGNEGMDEVCIDGNITNAPASIDSKIRMILNKKPNGEDAIYYVNDLLASTHWGDFYFNEYIGDHEEYDDAINIIFVQDNGNTNSGMGPGANNPDKAHIKINGGFGRYLNGDAALEGQNFAHELNHVLGLSHTHLASQQDIFEYECLYNSADVTFDGPLNHNMARAGENQRYLSPLQVGHIRRNLLMTFKSRFLKELPTVREVIEVNDNFEVPLDEVVVWNGNFKVKYGGVLRVNGDLILADDSRIYVERGGKLVVDGGKITSCATNAKWRGILVEGGNKNAFISPQLESPKANIYSGVAGTVWIKNGGIIENAINGISTNNTHLGWPKLKDYWGGLVVVESGGTFTNCDRAVEFMKYGNQNTPDKSYFYEAVISKCVNGITNWSSDGISIEQCVFNEIERSAVVIYDAQAFVENGNHFDKVYTGIDLTSSRILNFEQRIGNISTQKNTFNEIENSMIQAYNAFNTEMVTIENNESDLTAFLRPRVGINMIGNGLYQISNNTLNHSDRGIGLFSSGSENNFSVIKDNSTFDVLYAIYSEGRNTGTQIQENCISSVVAGIQNAADGILSTQGSELKEVANCFTVLEKDVKNLNNSNPINYYVYWERIISECEYPDKEGPISIINSNVFSEAENCGTIGITGGDDNLFCELPSTTTGLIQSIVLLENGNSIQEGKCLQKAELALYSLYIKNENIQNGFNYFSGKSGFKNKIYALNLLLENEEYSNASNYLSTLSYSSPQEQNYIQAQSIFMEYLTSEEEYQLSEWDYSFLKNEAVASKEYAGIVASIFKFLTNEDIEWPQVEENSFNEVIESREISLNQTQDFSIYPNPIESNILKFGGIKMEENTEIQIFDVNGNQTLSTTLKNDYIDITELKKGIYFIEIINAKKGYREKLIRL